jgi:hypothetical protein
MNQAEKDCLALWEYMAEKGCLLKTEAIGELFAQGRISSKRYENDCPFCEQFYGDLCERCPWPMYNYKYNYRRCIHSGPYLVWTNIRDKQSAKAVYQYIKKFLEDKYAGSGEKY